MDGPQATLPADQAGKYETRSAMIAGSALRVEAEHAYRQVVWLSLLSARPWR